MACCIIFAWHTWREHDFFALCSRFIEWAVDNDHMEVFGLTTFIVCLIVLVIYIYIEGGTV